MPLFHVATLWCLLMFGRSHGAPSGDAPPGFCLNSAPGVKRMVSGIDITSLDLDLDSDTPGADGFKSPLISMTCSKDRKINIDGVEYDMPDQVWRITPYNTAKMSLHASTFTSTSDVKKDLAVRAEIKGAGWGSLSAFAFSASASYKNMEHTITNGSEFISQVMASVKSNDINLYPSSHEIMDPVAKQQLDNIKVNYNDGPQKYMDFIGRFGTHYFEVGRFGGLIQSLQTTSESYKNSHTEEEISAQASAQFGIWLEAKGGVDTSKVKIDTSYTKNTKETINLFGGRTNIFGGSDALKQWPPSVYAKPWMLGGQLVAISELVRDANQKQQLEIAVEQYVLRRYLSQLLRQLKELRTLRYTQMVDQLVYLVQNMMQLKMLNRNDVSKLGQSVEVYNNSGFKCEIGQYVTFQRRTNGDVLFNKTWNEYKFGFGDAGGDFWVGLEAVHDCCPLGEVNGKDPNYPAPCFLSLNATERSNDDAGYHFAVGKESNLYTLYVKQIWNDGIGDGMFKQNKWTFTTFDTPWKYGKPHCVSPEHGGWWHNPYNCKGTDLNGSWMQGIKWLPVKGEPVTPTFTKMQLMPLRRSPKLINLSKSIIA